MGERGYSSSNPGGAGRAVPDPEGEVTGNVTAVTGEETPSA